MKSILTGLFVTLLTVGVVYAACTVFSEATNRTVTEALVVGWVKPFPDEVLPNETHDVTISIINSEGKSLAPTQNVEVEVVLSDGLDDLGVNVDGSGMGWGYDGSVFSMAPGEEKHVTAKVKIPGGYDPEDGEVAVGFKVSRVD